MTKTRWCALLCVLLWLPGPTATAGEGPVRAPGLAVQRQGDDLLMCGGTASLNDSVAGDLVVCGGNVDVDAAVAGDVLALGGKVRLGGEVGRSVYAAAGQLNVAGKVGRNLRLGGGQLELGPRSEVAGNVLAAGGQLRLAGAVKGHVQIAAGRVIIDGPVAGDVTVTAGQLELGPRARIGGKLRYGSRDPLLRDAAAEVAGGIEPMSMPMRAGQAAGGAWHDEARGGAAGVFALMWTLGLVLLVAVLLALLPGACTALARTLRERPGISLLLGFVWLVCVPVAAVLMAVTVVGIPLAVLTLTLYAALLPVAYVVAAVGLGQWALLRWWPARAESLAPRVGAAAAALVALSVLGWVPVVGGLFGMLALLAGLGAVLLQIRQLASGTAAGPAA